MPVIITSIFSALIILMTVAFMIKVLHIAYKRKEISFRQLLLYVGSSVAVGSIVAISLPFAYTKLFHWVLGA
jgi:cadmium resistance protein CadD (predicted permease)